MNRVHSKKLLHTKWTAVSPINGEKHFVITEVEYDETARVLECRAQAVLTKRTFAIDWRSLNSTDLWVQGWQ